MSTEGTLVNNRYRIEAKLGQGGMGTVYRVFDRLTGQQVALKRVTAPEDQLVIGTLAVNPDPRLALAQEFRTLASLRHPNIISVLDYGFEPVEGEGQPTTRPYFTMELLTDPQPLVDYGSTQPLAARIELIVQILQALVYLHRRGIIHRDLKPDNVMVVNKQAKVLDFGLAAGRELLNNPDEVLVGTLAYIAPEVLKDSPASEASDLYAVGVMSYELLAGHHPFGLDDITQLAKDILQTPPDFSDLQIDLKLKAVLSKLLAKKPQERYASAQEAIAAYSDATGMSFQSENASIRESFLQAARFVGRENEVQQLTDAFRQAVNGQGSAWLIGGESGVGKSRLLDELRGLALVNGALVLRGQAIFEGGAPYRLWRDSLRRLCLQTELDDLEAGTLKPLIPDIGTLLERPIPDAPALEPQAARQRLLNTIDAVFQRQKQALLVLLEDLQWATESLAILAHMSRIAGSLPILIIATYRDDERPYLPHDLPDMKLMKLERLQPEAIAELSASMLGSIGRSGEIINLLQRETEGNVFFIVEVVRALAEEAGEMEHIGQVTLPHTVFAQGIQTVVQRRLERVPPNARALLEVAAVAGRELDLQVLRLVGANYGVALDSSTRLDHWLNVCADATVLEVQDARWRFTHDKLREGLINKLSAEQKQGLHRQIARVIEQIHLNDPAHTALLAYHWGEAGDAHQEVHYTALAGEQALSNGAHREAIHFLERAVALAGQTGMKATRHAQLEQELGDAYYGMGLLPETEEHLKRALALVGYPYPASQPILMLHILGEFARQGWHRLRMDHMQGDFQPGDEALRFITASRACEGLGRILFLQNNKTDMMYYGIQGLNRAEQAGAAGRAQQLRNYASMALGVGTVPLHRASAMFVRHARTIIDETSNDGARNWADQVIGIYAGGRGQWNEAETRLQRAVALAEKTGDWRRWHESCGLLCTVYTLMGRWTEALTLSEALAERATRHGDIQGQAVPQLSRARLAVRQGNFQDGVTQAESAIPLFERINDRVQVVSSNGLLAALHMRLEKWEKGSAYGEKALKLMAQTSPTAFYSLEGYVGAAEYYLALREIIGDEQSKVAAKAALGHLKKFAKIFDVGRPRWLAYQGWSDWLDGNPEQARASADLAVKEGQRLQMPYDEGIAHYQLARFLPAEDVQRKAHLERAAELFEALGAVWDLERAKAQTPEPS